MTNAVTFWVTDADFDSITFSKNGSKSKIAFIIPDCQSQDDVIKFFENNDGTEHFLELKEGNEETQTETWEYAGTEWKEVDTIMNTIDFFIYEE